MFFQYRLHKISNNLLYAEEISKRKYYPYFRKTVSLTCFKNQSNGKKKKKKGTGKKYLVMISLKNNLLLDCGSYIKFMTLYNSFIDFLIFIILLCHQY